MTLHPVWETPRTLALIVAGVAVAASAFGWVGYRLGSAPPAPAPQIIFQPGAIQLTLPAGPPAKARQ